MKVVEKIEFFSRIALKEAQDKRTQLLPEIHRQYMEACEKITLEANKKYEKTIAEETYKAEQMKNREILQANKQAKRSLIELRAQLTNDLFDGVLDMITDFIESEEYFDLLTENIKKVAEQYPQGVTVSICKRDMDYENIVLKIKGIDGVSVVEGSNEMLGGFTAQVNGKNIFIDNSYRTKLKEAKSSFNRFKITES